MNLYAYAGNNPISYDDPFGLCTADMASACEYADASKGGGGTSSSQEKTQAAAAQNNPVKFLGIQLNFVVVAGASLGAGVYCQNEG
ncbi:MAG TPA: hypothetical protein VMC86_10275, partial [Gemmatimonadales bacterium]|nr:hypothetical protein [Gemmatimonadales bacterium]